MRPALALAGLVLALLAPPAAGDAVVDCSSPPPAPASWATCYEVWAEVDPGYCLRQDDPGACLAMLEFSCTLDAPPSRCGGAMLAFGFREA